MSRTPVFKKCGCRAPVLDPAGHPVLGPDGKPQQTRLGARCPKLRRADGAWNPKHGTWHFQFEVSVPGAGRQVIAQGGLPDQHTAEAKVAAIRALLELADQCGDTPAGVVKLRLDIIERVRAALRDKTVLPTIEELRRAIGAGAPITKAVTVEQWLHAWLEGKTALRAGTRRSYTSHIQGYLIPHLGQVPLDKLRVKHLTTMFDAITAEAEQIPLYNAARRTAEADAKAAWHRHDTAAWRQAKARRDALPPYRRPATAVTRQLIKATLRTALSAACAQQLIAVNVAALVELPAGERPKAKVWTDERVKAWRATGTIPSPVMVWTPTQTKTFLAAAAGNRMGPIFAVIAVTGLRRGEAVGLRWADVDLKARALTVSQQIVQLGWATDTTAPKTEAGRRTLALDDDTVTQLKRHRTAQRSARNAAGTAWTDSGLVFTKPDGNHWHPETVTDEFLALAQHAGLPPIRLHDLRHGAASLALAAGVDIQVVSEMLGHSSTVITRDTYTSVFPELKHEAAAAIAGILAAAGTSDDGKPETTAADQHHDEGDTDDLEKAA